MVSGMHLAPCDVNAGCRICRLPPAAVGRLAARFLEKNQPPPPPVPSNEPMNYQARGAAQQARNARHRREEGQRGAGRIDRGAPRTLWCRDRARGKRYFLVPGAAGSKKGTACLTLSRIIQKSGNPAPDSRPGKLVLGDSGRGGNQPSLPIPKSLLQA